MMRDTVCLLAATLLPLPVVAQGAMIAPHIVVIDDRGRSSAVTLYNPGVGPIEVDVRMIFGIAVTDSAGEFLIQYSADSSERSAAPWLAAYPRRFTLAAQSRQTVRILARPPQDLADGEYWARLTVTTHDGSAPVHLADTAGIHVGVGLEVRTILPVYFRKGPMSTGLTIFAPRVRRESDSLAIRLPMQRTGTAAYLGHVGVELVNAAGVVVRHGDFAIAVFGDANPRMILPVRGLAAGSYRLRLEARTERAGVAAGTLVTAPPIRAEFAVIL